MDKYVTFGFDDRVIGTLGVRDGKFFATGPQPDQVRQFAEGAAMAIAQDDPDADPDSLTPEMVMERLVETMRGRCHAVWSDAEGNPITDEPKG